MSLDVKRALAVAMVSLIGMHAGCESPAGESRPMDGGDRYAALRARLVDEDVRASGVRDPRVLEAMRQVPRHEFVPDGYAPLAYVDEPLPIGHGQTISQPSLVAGMVEALRLRGGEKVLEIGTGSGYQTAILARLVPHVFSLEIIEPLAQAARARLSRLGYDNVSVRVGDGYHGWPEEAPFDAIVVTAAPGEIPAPLLEQLAIGGRLILPVGGTVQQLMLVTRTPDGFERRVMGTVRFVPLTGEASGAHGEP